MRNLRSSLAAVMGLGTLAGSVHAYAAERLVRTPEAFEAAVRASIPGDSVVLANGVWRNFEIMFTGEGTAAEPITLRAQTPGKVVISGKSNLRIAGRHLVVSGLTFKDGFSPSSEVIAFRKDNQALAFDSRVTETVIDGFNKPDRAAEDYWVGLYGQNNRFDHNHLQGKLNNGVTLAVVLSSVESQQNHHHIDHNYFGPRPPLGSNGGETIRVGTSQFSRTRSLTVVEDNYFEGCSGEVEIVSNKSGGNIYRRNVFVRSQGSLVLRHGDGNLVEDNVFLGGGLAHTGGVRVINAGQTVRNNYFHGLRGDGFTAALVMMNGVPNSPLNRYNQVLDARIEKNVFVDVKQVLFGAGADQERTLPPARSTLSGNVFLGAGDEAIFKAEAPIDGLAFVGNTVDGVAPPTDASGFEAKAIGRQTLPDGRVYPDAAARQALGLQAPVKLLAREETGVAWYPKGDQAVAFDSGRVLKIKPGQDQLSAAAVRAKAGDIIELAAGDYAEGRVVEVRQPLTFRAATGTQPVVAFDHATLFSLAGEGALKLQGLRLSGARAPDAVGNAVVRVSSSAPLSNYAVELLDTEVSHLGRGAFAVLRGEKGTFADHVTIRGSRFTDIGGVVLDLAGEAGGLGLYGAERVDITGSQFTRLGGPVLDLLRGGTDESTFGPRVWVKGSTFRDVAPGHPSMRLDGVQVVKLDGNLFERAAPARVTVHVGKPDLSEAGNTGAALEIVDQRK
ncbi:polysaccharide lyase 6 family protein [Caulobacter sp. RL271]|uniref:Polysaccharide lyase 6 family protein n=1 Tax=Caulobacter segnis TaxID=88688 RepID=A0ABY4ZSU0_9CAUL|nr:polysaccharide lyase 6 family protein [Caulobacter segnis]USQ95872.1 polysaccharide lyase 6 family protein [Caulobacter segnis]